MLIYEVVQKLAEAEKSVELTIMEEAIKATNIPNIEIKRRLTAVSDKKIIVTFEILVKDTAVFHCQTELTMIESLEILKSYIPLIDRYFLSRVVKFALEYKSLSAKDYQDLQFYRRKYGTI